MRLYSSKFCFEGMINQIFACFLPFFFSCSSPLVFPLILSQLSVKIHCVMFQTKQLASIIKTALNLILSGTRNVLIPILKQGLKLLFASNLVNLLQVLKPSPLSLSLSPCVCGEGEAPPTVVLWWIIQLIGLSFEKLPSTNALERLVRQQLEIKFWMLWRWM